MAYYKATTLPFCGKRQKITESEVQNGKAYFLHDVKNNIKISTKLHFAFTTFFIVITSEFCYANELTVCYRKTVARIACRKCQSRVNPPPPQMKHERFR